MGPLSRKYIRTSGTANRHKKFILTAIWGVDGFHAVDLMTSQQILILSTLWVMYWHRWLRKFFPGGQFHILVDYKFTWITAESTFQRALSNLSLKTILDVCLTHVTVLVLHHRSSGFRSCEDFAHRLDLRPARTAAGGNHQVSEWNLAARSGRDFQPLGGEGTMGFRKQWRLLSRVNPFFRKTFLDSPFRALAPLLVDLPVSSPPSRLDELTKIWCSGCLSFHAKVFGILPRFAMTMVVSQSFCGGRGARVDHVSFIVSGPAGMTTLKFLCSVEHARDKTTRSQIAKVGPQPIGGCNVYIWSRAGVRTPQNVTWNWVLAEGPLPHAMSLC
jgi:hypothetical protein